MNKPEQLRLAADIIEKNLPWERRSNGSLPWCVTTNQDPAISVINDWEIRLAPPPPEPVPLSSEDAPIGSVFMEPANVGKYGLAYIIPMQVASNGFVFGSVSRGAKLVTWEAAMDEGWLIKRPGEEWKPCSK